MGPGKTGEVVTITSYKPVTGKYVVFQLNGDERDEKRKEKRGRDGQTYQSIEVVVFHYSKNYFQKVLAVLQINSHNLT